MTLEELPLQQQQDYRREEVQLSQRVKAKSRVRENSRAGVAIRLNRKCSPNTNFNFSTKTDGRLRN
jgi:hypothetical protein